MAVRRLILSLALVACVALAGPAWAGSLQFHGNSFAMGGQGDLSFTPGGSLSITAGNGGMGALITDFFSTSCGGDCPVVGGYMTLTTGGQTSGFASGGAFSYTFGAGGSI